MSLCPFLCILLLSWGAHSFSLPPRTYAKWEHASSVARRGIIKAPCRLQVSAGYNQEEKPDPARMRVKHIKAELDAYGVSYDDVFEKEPLVRRLIQARASGGRSGNINNRQPNPQQQQQQLGAPGVVGMTEEEFWRSVEQSQPSQPPPQARSSDDDFWKAVKAKVKRQTPGAANGGDFFGSVQQPAPSPKVSREPTTQFFEAVEDGWGSVSPLNEGNTIKVEQPKEKPKTQFFEPVQAGWGSVTPQQGINLDPPKNQPTTHFFGSNENGGGSVAPQQGINVEHPRRKPRTQSFGAVEGVGKSVSSQPKRSEEPSYQPQQPSQPEPSKSLNNHEYWNVAAQRQQPSANRAAQPPASQDGWSSPPPQSQTTNMEDPWISGNPRDGWPTSQPTRGVSSNNDASEPWSSSTTRSESTRDYNPQSIRQDEHPNAPGSLGMTEEEFWRSVEQSVQQPQYRQPRMDDDDFWKAVKAKVKRQNPGDSGSDFFSSMQQPTPVRPQRTQSQFFGGATEDPWAQPKSSTTRQAERGVNMSEEDYWSSRSAERNDGGGNNFGYSGGMSPDGLL